MAKITNSKELQEEKIKLLLIKDGLEKDFQKTAKSLHARIAPFERFAKNTLRTPVSHSSLKERPILNGALQYGVPLLIDRLLLGKRKFLLKEVVSWLSGLAARRVVENPPKETFSRLNELFTKVNRIPFVGKFIEKQLKKVR